MYLRSKTKARLSAQLLGTVTLLFLPSLASGQADASSASTKTGEPDSVPVESRASSADDTSADGTATTQPTEPEPTPEPLVDPYEEAKERVGRAEQLYEEGNYDAALTEFQRAYDTMLGHPARSYVLFNIGRCQEKLYRYDAAIESYEQYLKEAGPDADDRATVSAKIELLEGLLGVVKLDVEAKKGAGPATYQLWVDGRLVGENASKFSIPSGNHEVEIRAEGFEPSLKEVQVAARQEKQISFSLSPLAKEYKGIKPTYFYVTGGMALAAGAVGAVYGVMTLNKHSEIENTPPPLVRPQDEDQIKQRALMADVFLISAGVLATSATVLAFLTDWSRPSAQEDPVRNVRVKKVGFGASPAGGFINLSGTF